MCMVSIYIRRGTLWMRSGILTILIVSPFFTHNAPINLCRDWIKREKVLIGAHASFILNFLWSREWTWLGTLSHLHWKWLWCQHIQFFMQSIYNFGSLEDLMSKIKKYKTILEVMGFWMHRRIKFFMQASMHCWRLVKKQDVKEFWSGSRYLFGDI